MSDSAIDAAVDQESTDRRAEGALLQKTQAYLKLRLQRLAPSAVLTQAWEEFYSTYTQVIRSYALGCCIPPVEIDDLVQEVWAQVIAKLPEFHWNENRPGLRAWLYALISHKAVDLVRRKVHQGPEAQCTSSRSMEELISHEPDPSKALEQRWQRELIVCVLARLCRQMSDDGSQLLKLRLVEGRPVPEVAAALGLTAEQVWSRQHRLVQKLRVSLALVAGEHFGKSE
jgi:RNA polymerase sigma factor (sigma-70 family)